MAERAFETGEFFGTDCNSRLHVLHQVVDVYRTKIRGDIEGIEGDEIARKRVEDYANSIRPKGFIVRPTCLLAQPTLKITFRTMSPFIPLI